MNTSIAPLLRGVIVEQPYPLVFVTIGGAHLYGFASPDSDYDLRGVHVLPAREVLGLLPARETIERTEIREGCEIDLVTHDARKFFEMMLKRNGYVPEQLFSPLIASTSAAHRELCGIARDCVTRQHAHHYLGFAENQWTLFAKGSPPRVKPLLYVYRVLLTGIHLMRTGEIEASLPQLNERFRLPVVDELIARKRAGPEQSTLNDVDVTMHRREFERLIAALEQAGRKSTLPDVTTGRDALSELLVRLRLDVVSA